MGELILSSVLRELKILLTYSCDNDNVNSSKHKLVMGWGLGKGPTRGFASHAVTLAVGVLWASGYPSSYMLAPLSNSPHEQNIASWFTESTLNMHLKMLIELSGVGWNWKSSKETYALQKGKKPETLIMFPEKNHTALLELWSSFRSWLQAPALDCVPEQARASSQLRQLLSGDLLGFIPCQTAHHEKHLGSSGVTCEAGGVCACPAPRPLFASPCRQAFHTCPRDSGLLASV